MIRRIANAVSLQLRVQWRSFFPHVYLGMAVLAIAVFHFAVPAEYTEWFLPAFLFAEPGVLGFTLVTAQLFLERGEGSVTALAVTPLRSGEYVFSLVLTSALLATLAGLVVAAGVEGVDWRLAHLIAPLFTTTLLIGFLGIAIAARFREYTRFLVGGLMPVMMLLLAPLWAYFELLPRAGFVWIPSDAAIFAIAHASRADLDPGRAVLYCALLVVYTVGAFLWARFAFDRRVLARLESA